ncbi:MAG: fluoride efflux transporter CrcB [Nitrosopumilales archaeon]|nr:MAG: fluoride efflux transporter CrcB [Nitrosopumilales archaeon]RPJ30223.1 MAG: fluoride efflux transporter CrcB [Nitrosopumilales archaeon]
MKGLEFVLLGVGALAGAFLRYKLVSSTIVIGTFPVNLLIINVIGSFILGVFSILSIFWNLDTKYSLLFAIGFCGSFTTMSSFALESVNLLDNKQFALFGLNILGNVGLSLGAIILGRSITITIMKL